MPARGAGSLRQPLLYSSWPQVTSLRASPGHRYRALSPKPPRAASHLQPAATPARGAGSFRQPLLPSSWPQATSLRASPGHRYRAPSPKPPRAASHLQLAATPRLDDFAALTSATPPQHSPSSDACGSELAHASIRSPCLSSERGVQPVACVCHVVRRWSTGSGHRSVSAGLPELLQRSTGPATRLSGS